MSEVKKNFLVRNRIDGKSLTTGMVNWKTRVYKIFLFRDLRQICTDGERLWGYASCTVEGSFIQQKCFFLHTTFMLYAVLGALENEQTFPRFRLQLLCRGISLNLTQQM